MDEWKEHYTLHFSVQQRCKYECGHVKELVNYKIKLHYWHRGCVSVVLPISGSVGLQSDGIHNDRFQAGSRC